MSRYASAPCGAVRQVLLTRQGIALEPLPKVSVDFIPSADRTLLVSAVPACRHADGTISSPCPEQGVRRMASEDSDQLLARLSVVQRLGDLRDFDQACGRQMTARRAQLDAVRELLEIRILRGAKRILAEERNDYVEEVGPPADVVSPQVLLVVVAPAVDEQPADTEELPELLETALTALSLHHYEAVGYLIAGSVATSCCPIGLLDEANGEATFSINESDDPIRADRPFLLVFRTARIVTAHAVKARASTGGYSGFPAYSRIQPVTLLSRRATK
jgi:hypothetical protein